MANKDENKTYSVDEIMETILNGPGDCKIVGSSVYKWKARGEPVRDIDCICNNTEQAKNNLVGKLGAKVTRNNNFIKEDFDDYNNLTVGKINIDLIGSNSFINHDSSKETNFVNAVQLSKSGLQSKDSSFFNTKKKQVDFVMKNLSEGRYCPWDNMRVKDYQYFSQFSKIPEGECRANGFYKNGKPWYKQYQ